jgi:transposase
LKKRSWKHGLTENTLLVTVDVGKFKNTGYYRGPDGTDVPTFDFGNCGEGFKTFWSRIKQGMRQFNLTEVVVGLESTGSYAEPLLHFLRKRGVQLVQVAPAHTKKAKELFDNSPNKTDDKDPKVIADVIELGRALTVVIPDGVAADLRRLTHSRERSQERQTRLYNQLRDLVFLIFPEFESVMSDFSTKSARYLIENYGTPTRLLTLTLEELTAILRRVSKGRLGSERAQALYELAQTSVGISEGQLSIFMEIQHELHLIEDCDRFIAVVEEQMLLSLEKVPASRFLLSIPSLGKVTLAALIGEVGDFGQFKTIAELLKYAGLNLYEISSGEHKGQRRISKRGRPLMRKLLYFAALRMISKRGIFHEQYQKYLQHGMLKNKALIAICRKLLSMMLALVRDQREYLANDAACSEYQNAA